ncbi:EAL domain-containing protein [Rhodobacteraceae bacterium W635]|uniref:EAL domain-containing protein n=1 Tax=Nioella halotolerans TaxID=2303578 RepID=UPI000E3C43EE|nr:EAL domain-containing protein [Rhodobacteraceae bacterium W635]
MTGATPSTTVDTARLTRAFENGDLRLHYQPKVNVSRRWPEIVGYEALARWPLAGGGFISPDLFISLAEECGLILPFDSWVMETVCKELARPKAHATRPGPGMSVNVSPQHFKQPYFAQSVADILSRTGADPAALTLEITERAVLSKDETTLKNTRLLNEIGVSLSLDDFGTGYSSLFYLRDLPIQEVKLDRSFISGLPYRHRDAAIVNATINLAAELGLLVVAEGVELARQAEWLRLKGCQTIQGFLYGRPAARDWTDAVESNVMGGSAQ